MQRGQRGLNWGLICNVFFSRCDDTCSSNLTSVYLKFRDMMYKTRDYLCQNGAPGSLTQLLSSANLKIFSIRSQSFTACDNDGPEQEKLLRASWRVIKIHQMLIQEIIVWIVCCGNSSVVTVHQDCWLSESRQTGLWLETLTMHCLNMQPAVSQ